MRPQIKPGLRRLRYGDGAIQIGLSPAAGIRLEGLGPHEAELLDQLDGTRPVAALLTWAGERGIDELRVHALLGLLARSGVLTGAPTDRAHLARFAEAERHRLAPDAQAWSVAYDDAGDGFEVLARRRDHRVLIAGRGRLAEAVALATRRTGLEIEIGDLPAALPGPAYSLIILTAADALPTTWGTPLLRAGVPHLAAVAGVDRIVIGPLVEPGRTACLRCVELRRADRDPAWPVIAAQLGARAGSPRGEGALVSVAAGLLALQACSWVDGRVQPAAFGATLTLTLPDALPVRRTWLPHPRCGCCGLEATVPAASCAAPR
jgi:bacteriocin biosynthesis cyclodehydratase domain-containing protein